MRQSLRGLLLGHSVDRRATRTPRTIAKRRQALPLAVLEALEKRQLLSALSITAIPFTGVGSGGVIGNGANSASGLIMDSNGNLFGTTANGGAHGNGTLFEVAAGTHTITVLANFDTATTGGSPRGQIAIDAQGNIYGDTLLGGANGDGIVWEVVKNSGNVTVLGNLSNSTGFGAFGGVTLNAQGDLFGTASEGGLHTDGTIFEIPKSTGILAPIFSFNDNFIDGADPSANLANDNGATPSGGIFIDSQGDLFGTASTGGTDGVHDLDVGTLWELSATNGFSVLAPFSFDGSTGVFPATGVVMDSSGDIFGVTDQTSINGGEGVVFEFAQGATAITTYAAFNGNNGLHPTDLIIDSQGNLYGMTDGDQLNDGGNEGTLFEIPVGTQTINTLFSFNGTDGLEPEGNLVMDANGNFYGTTLGGGPHNDSPGGDGVVFELSQTGPAAKLAFPTAPVSTTAGATLSPLTIDIEDANGNIVTTDNSTVALTLSGGTHGATLGGTVTATAVNGVATFSTLSISTAGTAYTLSATDGALTAVTSSAFNITAAGGGGGATGLVPSIVSSKVPTSVIGGVALHGATLKLDLTNSSATTDSAIVKIYASTDAALDTSTGTLLATTPKSTTVKGDKSSPLSITIPSFPAGLASGNYFLIAETIDPADNTNVIDAATPITVAAPFVSLSETLTSKLPASLVSNSTVKNGSVTLTITNNGNVPSKGITPITVTASTTSGTLGANITAISPNLNLPVGKPVKVTVPIKSLPALPNGNYFFVAQTTDAFAHGTSLASTATTTVIAAPFIAFAATLGPVVKIQSGDTLTLTNNGNSNDITPLHVTFGFSTDAAGTTPAGLTFVLATKAMHLNVGKPLKLHFTNWADILSTLVSGTPYFLTLTITDASGNAASAVSSNSFTL